MKKLAILALALLAACGEYFPYENATIPRNTVECSWRREGVSHGFMTMGYEACLYAAKRYGLTEIVTAEQKAAARDARERSRTPAQRERANECSRQRDEQARSGRGGYGLYLADDPPACGIPAFPL